MFHRLTVLGILLSWLNLTPLFAQPAGNDRFLQLDRNNDGQLARDQIDTLEAYRRYEAAMPIKYLTKDDPPALLLYSFANEYVTNESNLGLVVHHPKFGIALKERMDKLGIECIVQYRDAETGQIIRHGEDERPVTSVEFFRGQFEKVRGGGSSR